jgi:hypothetical protein
MEETDSVAKEVSHDEAMGRLTKDFAMLEYILHGVASLISEDRKIGEIITAGLSFLRVEEIVRELARHRLGEDDLRLMTEAVGLAETARKNRNDIIHSMWLQLGVAPERLIRCPSAKASDSSRWAKPRPRARSLPSWRTSMPPSSH